MRYYLPIILAIATLAGGAAFWLIAVSWAHKRYGYSSTS